MFHGHFLDFSTFSRSGRPELEEATRRTDFPEFHDTNNIEKTSPHKYMIVRNSFIWKRRIAKIEFKSVQ